VKQIIKKEKKADGTTLKGCTNQDSADVLILFLLPNMKRPVKV